MPGQILIVDGDPLVLQQAAAHFSRAGWDPAVARDAMHAMRIARDQRPKVIVLNSALPGGGMMTLTRLKSNINTAAIPVVTVTDVPEVYSSAGANACVSSMQDLATLARAVNACVADTSPPLEAPGNVLREPLRLAAVQQSGFLDPAPNESIDALTHLLARLLNVPVALVSIIDKDRQFFKSQTGLQPPWATERQTRLSHSFCQWVVAGRQELVINDAREHPVLRANLAIKDLGVVAYAGVPVESQGHHIGSFCAIDSAPREWSATELGVLRRLADVVQAFGLPPDAHKEYKLDVLTYGIDGARKVLLDLVEELKPGEKKLLWEVLGQLSRRIAATAAEAASQI